MMYQFLLMMKMIDLTILRVLTHKFQRAHPMRSKCLHFVTVFQLIPMKITRRARIISLGLQVMINRICQLFLSFFCKLFSFLLVG